MKYHEATTKLALQYNLRLKTKMIMRLILSKIYSTNRSKEIIVNEYKDENTIIDFE
jgi:hypothetical protein